MKNKYKYFEELLRFKRETESRLDQINEAINNLDKKFLGKNEKHIILRRLQKEEIDIGRMWTDVDMKILDYNPESYHEAALKILHLTNRFTPLGDSDNDRVISAIKECALIIYNSKETEERRSIEA